MAADKRRAFAREYIVDHNATQAAIRAGYSPKTAYSAGERLLRNVEVGAEIAALEKRRRSECIASADELETFLTAVVREETDEEVVVSERVGDGISETRIVRKKACISDRIKAADRLLKRYERIETQSAQAPSNAAPGNSVTIVIPDNGR